MITPLEAIPTAKSFHPVEHLRLVKFLNQQTSICGAIAYGEF